MRFRPLGRTGLQVSALTIGTGGLASTGRDLREAAIAMAAALDGGVNAVELAANDKVAVDAIAALVANGAAARDLAVFARITPRVAMPLPSPHIAASEAFPGASIRAEAEGLLRRLGVERLGVLQIHPWCPEWLEEGDWRETLEKLRAEGKVAGIGISLFDHDVDAAATAVASGAVDTVQVMLNIFDQGPAANLLPFCRHRGVGVIARTPFLYGGLTPDVFASAFPDDGWRREYFASEHLAETRVRAHGLTREAPDVDLDGLALRFCLAQPDVATIAAGMLTPAHVRANLHAVEAGALDATTMRNLAAHRWLC